MWCQRWEFVYYGLYYYCVNLLRYVCVNSKSLEYFKLLGKLQFIILFFMYYDSLNIATICVCIATQLLKLILFYFILFVC